MQKTYKDTIQMWQLTADSGKILHRRGTEDYTVIRNATVTDPEKWEEVAENIAEVIAAHNAKLDEITAYDNSDAVNSFTLDGLPMWLDKGTRVGLVNSVTTEKTAGHATTTLWYGTASVTIPVDAALSMLAALELYALACYNVTAAHRAAVCALTDPAAIEAYDHTAGYPSHPEFNTAQQ